MKKTLTTILAVIFLIQLHAQVTLNNSNLPIVLITTTNNQAIVDADKITAQMKVIDNGANQRNNVTDTKYNYSGTIGIEIRGNSSASFNQKQYGLETRLANGDDAKVSILGMPAESDWILSAPYNDVSMVRNVLAFKIWNDMGHYAPRTKMVELVINNKYTGVYMFTEKIKRDSNRVDVAKLKTTDNLGRDVTGGYIMKIDAESGNTSEKTFISQVKGFKIATNSTTQTQTDNITWGYEYPKSSDITAQQQAYIKKYIDTVETYLRDGNMKYRDYISRTSFIDYFIHSELSKNADGFKKSSFFHKEKEKADGSKGKLKAGPVWDYNLGYGNCSFCGGNKTTDWLYKGCETLPVPALWTNLLKDNEYANAVKCRYKELRDSLLKKETIHASIDLAMNPLVEASARQFATYKELLSTLPLPAPGSFPFPANPNDPIGWFVGYRVNSYAAEKDSLKKFFAKRLTWLDANMPGTCTVTNVDKVVLNAQNAAVSVFPNPTNDVFTVSTGLEVRKIEIYNLAGEMIDEMPVNTKDPILISSLKTQNAGTYFVRTLTDSNVYSTKVIRK